MRLKALLCLLMPHAWGDFTPVNPARLMREPKRSWIAIRYCQRCDAPDQLSIIEGARLRQWFTPDKLEREKLS